MATESELLRATNGWTAQVLVRTYEGKTAAEQLETEARMLALRGYEPEAQTEDGGHVHVGRLLVTGGLSILAGRAGIRSKGKTTVTFSRMRGPLVDVVVQEVNRPFLATGTRISEVARVTNVNVIDAELPVRILRGIPQGQADVVIGHLARLGMKCHIGRVGSPDAPASPPGDERDLPAQLERLAALRRDGVLTEEEFVQSKTRLLEGKPGGPA